jgi:hypothetical protein
MGTTTFTGPIKAGDIINTSGTTLGQDVKNTGFVVMVQTADITQAGTTTALKTSIVIPANSEIVEIKLYASVAWASSATLSIGTTATSNELVVTAASPTVTQNVLNPTTLATVNKWTNVGTNDVAIYALSSTGTGGVGRLMVKYIQSNN